MSDPRASFASGVVNGDHEELRSAFERTTLIVRIGDATLRTVTGQVIAYQLATLWIRLFERIVIEGAETAPSLIPLVPGPFVPGLQAMLQYLGPCNHERSDDAVIVGIGSDAGYGCDVYVGSSGWGASVSLEDPVPVEPTDNTLGALAAGTLGAAEAFKWAFLGRIRGAVNRAYSISLLDYGSESVVSPELPKDLRLDATVFGCGSIGVGFLQAALLLPGLSADLVLVDNGALEAKNFYKYPLVTSFWAESGYDKSRWAAEEINRVGLPIRAVPFVGTAQEYVATLPADYRLPLAISAVDTAEARVEVQDALPEAIVNAGITGTTAEVSFHVFNDGPCLACLSMEEQLESWDPYVIATHTGLPPLRVRELITGNLRMTRADIDTMRDAGVLRPDMIESIADYEHQPLLSLWNRVAYSEAIVTTESGEPAQVTTAFVSAFAGVLVLAEAVKRSNPVLRPFQVSNSYRQDLIGVPAGGPFLYDRDASGRCLCHSGFRQRVYRRKYG